MTAPSPPSGKARALRGVIDRIDALSGADRIALRDIFLAFGEASFVPALLVPALLVVSPLSGIPLFSSVCGLSIALISLQMLLRRDHLWLPAAFLDRHIRGSALHAGMQRIGRFADFIDRHTSERLTVLTRPPLGVLVPLACLASGLAMPFLELVPFSSSILGTAVTLFAVSLLARDGALVVAGLATMAVAAILPLTIVTQIVD